MISVDEALETVLAHSGEFGSEQIPLDQGIGRVLQEDWFGDRDMPPYDRVSMDGIAINAAGAEGKDRLKIAGIVAAGDPQASLSDPAQCLEIMTGAVLPHGTDTVIRYEDLEIADGYARINVALQPGKNVHAKGLDRKAGELLVQSGTLLSASEIGVGASIGRHQILVSHQPRTIIISTGDELVEIDESPLPHQIRRGNVYRMQATLQHLGLAVETGHLRDDLEASVKFLEDYLQRFDLLILSGGVSKGKFDYLPEALRRCGVQQHFHRVAQRPGKPLWFGTHPSGPVVFALPGNPISSFMCLHVYVLDWLRSSQGLGPQARPMASLTEPIEFRPDLTYFLEVKISYDQDGRVLAQPMKGQGSGDLTNLCRGDAFVKLPRGKVRYEQGEVYELYPYR